MRLDGRFYKSEVNDAEYIRKQEGNEGIYSANHKQSLHQSNLEQEINEAREKIMNYPNMTLEQKQILFEKVKQEILQLSKMTPEELEAQQREFMEMKEQYRQQFEEYQARTEAFMDSIKERRGRGR